jgi:branched-chain amino acid transport system ATP-binding protein
VTEADSGEPVQSRPEKAAGPPSLLEAEYLGKQFRGVHAVEGISFSVAEREILGIIGPNGAGKTTIFNLIAGAFAPSSGSIRFYGKRIDRLPAHQRCRAGIGRTFQLIRPFGSMTVLENVATAASANGRHMRGAYELAEKVVARTGLGSIASKPAAQLTAVEGKRLELARALAGSPSLVLLDEIFSGLNAEEADDLVSIVRRLPSEGVTVILIEHNVRAIRAVSDRVIAVSAGRVICEGLPARVLTDPVVVESYLGVRASA